MEQGSGIHRTDNCQQTGFPSGEACLPAGSTAWEDQVEAKTKEEKNHEFSYFSKPVRNTKPSATVDLQVVYEMIKSDAYKEVTQTLREIDEPGVARDFKAEHFDYVTFSGTFTRRKKECLVNHSGLLCFDFDHLDDPTELKEALVKHEAIETELAFVSPSGNGLKWVISIDLSLATHEMWFNAVRNIVAPPYHVKVDSSGRDVSRACFLPYDPEVYINPKYLL